MNEKCQEVFFKLLKFPNIIKVLLDRFVENFDEAIVKKTLLCNIQRIVERHLHTLYLFLIIC